ncbi:MAG: hypothetical protein ACI8VC_002600 [Candidatus Endobugula sp.]
MHRLPIFLVQIALNAFSAMQAQAVPNFVCDDEGNCGHVSETYNDQLRYMIQHHTAMVRSEFYNVFFTGPIRSYFLGELYSIYQHSPNFFQQYLGNEVTGGIRVYNPNHDPLAGIRAKIEERAASGLGMMHGFNHVSPPVQPSSILDVTGLTRHGDIGAVGISEFAPSNLNIAYTEQRRASLFHYTSINARTGIIESNELRVSRGATAAFGNGQYLTSISPDRVVTRYNSELTQDQVSSGLMSLEGLTNYLGIPLYSGNAYVEIDVHDLHVRQAVTSIVGQGTRYSILNGIFFVPNQNNLPIARRLIGSGQLYAMPPQEADLLGLF